MSENKGPGPLGTPSNEGDRQRQVFGDCIAPGPLGHDASEWHPPLLPSPLLSEDRWHPPLLPQCQHPEADLALGLRDLQLLREGYGNVLSQDGKMAYGVHDKSGWSYRVDEYLTHRDTFFGSKAAYEAYLSNARAELAADGGKLRKKVIADRSKPKWEEAQDIFYAWTRKAYENELGPKADIPALISANMSEKLKLALRQVQADFGAPFEQQTMVARPKKTPRGYRLGTLSEHALGEAVDIRPGTNPQIEASQWKAILAFTGKSLDTATRLQKWKTAPEELHKAIVEINDLFVSKLEEAVAAQVKAGVADKGALAAAIKADANLKKIGPDFVRKFRSGFFDLPWALVKELHEEKFLWGATFDRIDLHHFEL